MNTFIFTDKKGYIKIIKAFNYNQALKKVKRGYILIDIIKRVK